MLEHSWNAQLKDLGLTHAGVTALGVISQNGEISQVQVAHIVGVQAQTMGKTLARLEAYGHIERVRSTTDRRSYLLTITESGLAALDRAEEVDNKLSQSGELANPDFQNMLISVIQELSTHEGGKEIFESATEGNLKPSTEKVNNLQVDSELSADTDVTAVIETDSGSGLKNK
ncbi:MULTISPECIES: MarR family winged helix-turn-helix transcriptional regulator [unclassified Rothia (in: high G+C Gram-positive bacteria)]|uniref:MarR family winged helix-turn-helix transcriptional regulator n=1 Tax=unclassified Rothia (in: high G+C Gram-positive bacteria) TaxID=2689056 RepID=UPI001EF5CD0C|nr:MULTISPECIES: MarR family transcriptional regulator [unclassified Rothia (in: high G+C Gram-positive bacteria)]